MPDPSELLAAARFLFAAHGCSAPSDANLRRAVSTAYYAVFHRVSQAAATRFMGTGHENSAGFAILYRALNHGEMRRTFAALAKATLSDKYRNLLHRSTLCQDMRAFAKAFPNLQTLRHLADYDPAFSFSVSGAAAVIDEAELALEAFERVPEDEKTDVLALLLAGSRG